MYDTTHTKLMIHTNLSTFLKVILFKLVNSES